MKFSSQAVEQFWQDGFLIEVTENFRPRLRRIVYDRHGIGWSFHDELNRLYHEEYPPE